nr:HAD hydrolase-like protein [Chloroflexota bacterium]
RLAPAPFLTPPGPGFTATNPAPTSPPGRGPVPGNGARLAALETAPGIPPVVVGKPEPRMYEEALLRMAARPETTAVIGDRLDTDIAGGVRAGLTTVLVLSGITTEADLAGSAVKPDLVCVNIEELIAVWERCTPDPLQ